ncbi:kynurenine--oxoglutarate transaminase 3-like isoform X2 [Photinus pyralis]|uniref:kynurenine--oxoglutarate transaminase 3-like isoform X2 n=1 Tax=Photinus pyralis TaxID=7054 RepID=UPI0012675BC4|nr:kynurenine--oxoglutarate transaminase 3-like isoform X2 [Photinus pyralis]
MRFVLLQNLITSSLYRVILRTAGWTHDRMGEQLLFDLRIITKEECPPSHISTHHVDLWRGCPDYLHSPEFVTALKEVVKSGDVALHQYTKGVGHPRLVSVLAKIYSNLLKRCIDPFDNILVCMDIYGAMTNTILSHITNGDEVIIVQPSSDFYEYIVGVAGGVTKFVPLRLKENVTTPSSGDWVLEDLELEKMFTSKTKLIILSSPNCHVGKVYTLKELETISRLCKMWNVVCVSDESEEFLVYQPQRFIRIASLPEMWERTITIGSFDTTFFLKGWKIAWAYGPSNLIGNLQTVHLNSIMTCPTQSQEAIALIFEKKLENLGINAVLFGDIAKSLLPKMQLMFDILSKVGLNPIQSDSGVYIITNTSNLDQSIDYSKYKDFVGWLAENVHIQAVPLQMFYKDGTCFKHFVRFCFNRKEDTLTLARDLLEKKFKLKTK